MIRFICNTKVIHEKTRTAFAFDTHHTKNKMGAALSIFGKINEESPHFSSLKKTAEYEIRRYAQAIAVETSYEAVRLFFLCAETSLVREF
jgi:hypothetical protein